MKIKLLSETYEITEKGTKKDINLHIKVVVADGMISILNHKGQHEFKFIRSNREMIRKIGRMIVRASDI